MRSVTNRLSIFSLTYHIILDRMFYTYAHTKPDGTIFYIGKGTKHRAWKTHRRNNHWKSIVQKYGSFNVEILANWKTEKEAYRIKINPLKWGYEVIV